ncbi:uncharacterized protein LOC143897570 [Temnothorax americanus]|uniref:uncharacterized protein LOC143897570 n=1 Tax=Temnothorax americanus TaxID=1964332 RepID=UPI0040697816
MVEFKEEKTKDGCKVIECVPISSWITYDHKLGSCVVQYMAPPYSTEDYKLIQDLIKSRVQPPEGWPRFSVNLKGNANTYKEGMSKLNILQVQSYTTDSESRGIEKAQKAIESLKSRADVEKMLSKENNESSSESSYTDTSSSDEKWKRQTKDKKKFVIEDSDETPTPTKPKCNFNMKQKTLKKPVTQKKSKSQTVLKKSKQYKNIINEPYMSSVKNNISNTSFTSSLRKSNKKTVENSSTTTETIQEQASEDVFSDILSNVEFPEMSTDTTSLKKL